LHRVGVGEVEAGGSIAGVDLQDELELTHIDVSKIVKDEHFYTEYDSTYDSYIIEEDEEERLLDYLEPAMVRGGSCVDFHSSSFFPKRWFGLVVVLRADTEKIFDRLTARGYSEAKREENLDAEICGVCEEEARNSFDQRIILIRPSNELSEMLETVEMVRATMKQCTPAFQEELTFAESSPVADGEENGDESASANDKTNDDESASGNNNHSSFAAAAAVSGSKDSNMMSNRINDGGFSFLKNGETNI
jgi:adenylate kinase